MKKSSNTEVTSSVKRRSFWTMILLFCLFASPGIIAFIVYLHPAWLATQSTNRGAWVQPRMFMPALGKTTKWHLVYWSPQGCQKSCVTSLDMLARIRLALGRRLYVTDVCLAENANAKALMPYVAHTLEQRDVRVAVLSHEESQALRDRYHAPHFFLANPANQLILTYALPAKSEAIFHDLKHVLERG